MTQSVVNEFHAIDVSDNYGQGKVLGNIEYISHFVKIGAVVKPRYAVVITDILYFFLSVFPFGYIATDANDTC